MGGRRAFRRMVIPHQGQHAAPRRSPCHIGMAEHIPRAVDPRSLAVPERKDAVIFALAAHLGLLCAPTGRGCQLLVDAGCENNPGGIERLAEPVQLLVERTQRRAAIAGNEPSGVAALQPVAFVLHQHHADHGLRAGHENPLFGQIEFVIQRDFPITQDRDIDRQIGAAGCRLVALCIARHHISPHNSFLPSWGIFILSTRGKNRTG